MHGQVAATLEEASWRNAILPLCQLATRYLTAYAALRSIIQGPFPP